MFRYVDPLCLLPLTMYPKTHRYTHTYTYNAHTPTHTHTHSSINLVKHLTHNNWTYTNNKHLNKKSNTMDLTGLSMPIY